MRILVEDERMDKNKQQNSVRESKPQSKFKGLVAVDLSTAFLGTLLSARPECRLFQIALLFLVFIAKRPGCHSAGLK